MSKHAKRTRSRRILAFATAALLTLGTLSPALAAGSADGSSVGKYYSEFDNWMAVVDAEAELNKQIGAEGFVLLKNEQSNLPFSGSVRNISVFGKNSVDPVYSGSGSSGGTSGNTISIIASLENAGFHVNPALVDFYSDTEASGPVRPSMGFATYNYHSYFPTAETPLELYTNTVRASYDRYGDAAVIVFSRTGGEGTDLPRSSFVTEEFAGQVPDPNNARAFPTFEQVSDPNYKYFGGQGRESDPTEHYLELDDHEEALLEEVTAKFDKVVVILNSSNVMEIGESITANPKVQSVIWAPGAGQNGFDALGKILNGTVNPSGRTTDTFMTDFTKDPAYQNFANNNIGFYANGTAGNQYLTEDGQIYENNFADFLGIEGVEYEEGIYLGYKYYETRGFADGSEWYNAAVNYPFGYGLSYTTFEWEVGRLNISNGALDQNSVITVDVTVTNTGMYAGKDVVELYFSAPYTEGQTEKSHVVLGAFEKTKTLRPSESQTVTLTFSGFDMASFDAYDKDGDGHKGYELDAGTYTIYIGRDAHDAWKNGEALTITGTEINIDTDPATGAAIAPRFNESTNEMMGHTLSRADWEGTFPTTPTEDDLMRSDEWLKNFAMPLAADATADNAVVQPWYDENNPRFGGQAPWYSASAPAFRSAEDAYSAENPAPLQLVDLAGAAYDDPRWDTLVSQLTVDQAYDTMKATMFQFNAIDAIGAPVAGHSDGPVGITGAWVGGGRSVLKPFAGDHKFSFATETLVGCTWNKDIARRQGELIGDYGLWCNVVGWYGPGVNIHRTPFSGRNFEYYSEDATLSGALVSNVIAGARSKGMVTFMKHFALNDSETNRDTDGIATWADEQTMREIYLKPFEWAVKKGGSNGAMSSFNRIGFDWSGANYALLTETLRGEWGFTGVVITDAHGAGQGCMNGNQMIRAGNDMSLDSREGSIARIVNSDESNTATQLTALHNTVKHILYNQLNSAAMSNGLAMEEVTYSPDSANAAGAVFQAVQGEAFTASVADETSEDDSYVMVLGRLPEGLRLNSATGEITGTVSRSAPVGSYTIQIAKTLKGADTANGEAYLFSASVTGGFGGMNGLVNFTIEVADDGAADPVQTVSVTGLEKIGSIGNTDYYAFTMSDGSEFYYTVANGQDGLSGPAGPAGANGTSAAPVTSGTASSGGNNTLSILALVVGIAGLAAGGYSIASGKKKETANK